VTGEIVDDDGVLRIERIEVRYEIAVPEGREEAARRALERHVDGCPVAQTLLPCVEIEWEADLRTAED
jgi:uncharacterized OsmC-like protein